MINLGCSDKEVESMISQSDNIHQPLGERGKTEKYELVDPTPTVGAPAGFGNSIFGRGVIIFCVVALIGVIVKKLVSKRKENVKIN